MNSCNLRRGLAALAIGVASAANAGTVTFEDVPASLFSPGESFVSATSLRFSVPLIVSNPFISPAPQPGFGFVDTAAGLSIFSNAPTGNISQFYAGLSDNLLRVTSVDAPDFSISGFDFGFVPAVPSANSTSPGALIAVWEDVTGATGFLGFDFGNSDASGDWAFLRANWNAPSFASVGPAPNTFLRSVEFLACIDYNAGCAWPNQNQGQFAIDNIDFGVPTPGSWLLAGLGLAGLAVTRRRVAR